MLVSKLHMDGQPTTVFTPFTPRPQTKLVGYDFVWHLLRTVRVKDITLYNSVLVLLLYTRVPFEHVLRMFTAAFFVVVKEKSVSLNVH